jgi:EpsI family protein
MPAPSLSFAFLRSGSMRVLSVVLIAQAAVFFGFSRKEYVPNPRPLKEFVTSAGQWTLAQEGVIDQQTLEVLAADDTLSRQYANQDRTAVAGLFIAFFKTQRTGQMPHSPKNCLPGAGWVPSESGKMTVQVSGDRSIEVNRYLVSRGDERSLVIYWYQSRDRVIASEYKARVYLVADAIRYNRTDTALVRVTVPLRGDVARAEAAAVDFVKTFFGPLREQLPS